uniref:Secreted protein n=1 Tax=Mesocestoides corti TaxID=53468 RepID=A0A5K3EYC2_MESCO
MLSSDKFVMSVLQILKVTGAQVTDGIKHITGGAICSSSLSGLTSTSRECACMRPRVDQ